MMLLKVFTASIKISIFFCEIFPLEKTSFPSRIGSRINEIFLYVGLLSSIYELAINNLTALDPISIAANFFILNLFMDLTFQ